MLELYGHPFSSYTWKVLIALRANDTPFELRSLDDGNADHAAHAQIVRQAGPLGKFPVLADGENLIFEASAIIEYLDQHHVGFHRFVPEDPDAAIGVRMMDRVFDNYVMTPVQQIVSEHLRNPENPDAERIGEAEASLHRSCEWLEGWLEYYPAAGQIGLIECAAAPALFYADWVAPFGEALPRLKRWRAHLLSLPPVSRCVDEARPWREAFPPGAPDRD